MKMKNTSPVADDLLLKIFNESTSAFHALYGAPSSDIEFIVCASPQELDDIRFARSGQRSEKTGDSFYDGYFVAPGERTDTLTIFVVPKADMEEGARQFFMEKEEGSLKDAPLSPEEREARCLRLMPFFMFVELITHEYSHLCSFERLMRLTDWEDPSLPAHSLDYHLHDEVIARYRSMKTLLSMTAFCMDADLLYNLWYNCNHVVEQISREADEVYRRFIAINRKGVEDTLATIQREQGLSRREMRLELEMELEHPLTCPNRSVRRTLPYLTDLEIIEFITQEGMESSTIIVKYFLLCPDATDGGAQRAGLKQVFMEYLTAGQEDAVPPMEPDRLKLDKMIAIPFYEYIPQFHLEGDLDVLRAFQAYLKREQAAKES